MIQKSSISHLILTLFISMSTIMVHGQQDPQFTHYMYNTMVVNSAYAGQRDVLSATALYRTQWVGISGAPETVTFGIHSPLRNQRLGLGLNFVSDKLGPSNESSIDANVSYTLPVNDSGDLELSFGLKAGLHLLNVDWSKGSFQTNEFLFSENLSQISPALGAGLYLHTNNWYLGASIPNILQTEHYSDFKQSLATERVHFFFIGGYVFDVNSDLKLKPAFFVKGVSGAPVIGDISLNSLYQEKFTFGLAYRYQDAFSALLGFQVNPNLFIGYSYDRTTNVLRDYNTSLPKHNNGTHEIMLRFELSAKSNKFLSPRFF